MANKRKIRSLEISINAIVEGDVNGVYQVPITVYYPERLGAEFKLSLEDVLQKLAADAAVEVRKLVDNPNPISAS